LPGGHLATAESETLYAVKVVESPFPLTGVAMSRGVISQAGRTAWAQFLGD
jgi:hypothetical protein